MDSVKYCNIDVVSLSDIYINPNYCAFVKKCLETGGNFSEVELSYWSNKTYLPAKDKIFYYEGAIRRFVIKIMSLKYFKYVNVLSSPRVFSVFYKGLCREYLPRIGYSDGSTFRYSINNGNHRLAILNVMGAEELPLVRVETDVVHGEEELKHSLDKLGKDILRGCKSFLESSEWEEFKYTDTYKNLFYTE